MIYQIHLNCFLFADDTNSYYESDDLAILGRKVNKKLKKVKFWLRCNKLALIVEKKNCVLFHSPRQKVTESAEIKLGRQFIKRTLCGHLTWTSDLKVSHRRTLQETFSEQRPDSFRPLFKVLFASAQAVKHRKVRGVNFLGAARSCGRIYCDPSLLRRGLGLGACGKCSEDEQAWLRKSSTLQSFDEDRLFDFVFLGIEATFTENNSK